MLYIVKEFPGNTVRPTGPFGIQLLFSMLTEAGRFVLVGYGWALQYGCSSSNMPMKLHPKMPDFLCSNPNVECRMEFLRVPKNHYAFIEYFWLLYKIHESG